MNYSNSQKTRFSAIVLLVMASGCAGTPVIIEEPLVVDNDTHQFINTRITINEDTPVGSHYLAQLRVLERELKASDVFKTIGKDVESDLVINLTLNRTHISGGDKTIDMVASAATLFLNPVKINNRTELTADVHAYGRLLKSYKYEQVFTTKIGITNVDDAAAINREEFKTIKNLATRLVNDLEADALLPKIARTEREIPDETPPRRTYLFGNFSLQRGVFNVQKAALELVNQETGHEYAIPMREEDTVFAISVVPGAYTFRRMVVTDRFGIYANSDSVDGGFVIEEGQALYVGDYKVTTSNTLGGTKIQYSVSVDNAKQTADWLIKSNPAFKNLDFYRYAGATAGSTSKIFPSNRSH